MLNVTCFMLPAVLRLQASEKGGDEDALPTIAMENRECSLLHLGDALAGILHHTIPSANAAQ